MSRAFALHFWVASALVSMPLGAQAPAENKVTVVAPRAADDGAATRVHVEDTEAAVGVSLEELAGRFANLHVDGGGAGSFGSLLALRGLTNTPYFSDPSVAVYLDDLPLGSSFSYPTGLFGFCDARLWRGPQATAFGRAGQGGVIVLSSARPGTVPGASLRAGFGSFDSRVVAFTAQSATLGDAGDSSEAGRKFDAAVSGYLSRRHGFIRNTQLNADVDGGETASASARLRWRATSTAQFTLQLLGNRQRDGAQPLVPLGGPLYTVSRGREGRTDIDFNGAAFKGEFDTAYGRLTSVTSHTDWRLDPYDNHLLLPPPLDSRITQRQRVWNQELRLDSRTGEQQGSDATVFPAASPVAWTLGAWFSDAATGGDVNRAITDLFPIEASSFQLDSRSLALFGEAAFAPAAHWRITAGLRAERIERGFDRGQAVPAPGRFAARRDFEALLPKLAASYALSAYTTATASVSLGAKPGGWSAFTADAERASFKQERARAFETGLDTVLARDTLHLAVRAFTYDIHDYQIERSFNATDYLVVNAPRARSFGGELEAVWRPMQSLTLETALGFTRATLREFVDPFTGTSYGGKRAPYVPGYDARLGASWHTANGWFASGSLAITGRTFYDEAENPLFMQRARTLIGARAGYDAARWRVSLFGENLADEGYYALIIPGVGHGVPGAPRTWGVELTGRL